MDGICQSHDAGVDLVEVGRQRKDLLLLCGVQNVGVGDEGLSCTGVQVAKQHLCRWAVDCTGELGSVDAIDFIWHIIRRYGELPKVVVNGGQGSAAVVAVLSHCIDDKGLHIQACVLGNMESSIQTACRAIIFASVTHQATKTAGVTYLTVHLPAPMLGQYMIHDHTAAVTT